jgi:predicted aspartyl protease
MTSTVTYPNSSPYQGNRPIAEVKLLGPVATIRLLALVDTGADYLQVPLAEAVAAGFNTGAAMPITVGTAGSPVGMTLLARETVSVEGKTVAVSVLLNPDPTSEPLLGREALLAAYDAGFNVNEWLWV